MNESARKITRYFFIYRNYLWENKLDDDSKTITVADLIYFVENEISNDDRGRLADNLI